ncbi:MAG: hypothetical protein RL011_37 [Pseudomonadota bacterium]
MQSPNYHRTPRLSPPGSSLLTPIAKLFLACSLGFFMGAVAAKATLKTKRSHSQLLAKRKAAPKAIAEVSQQADRDHSVFSSKLSEAPESSNCVNVPIREQGPFTVSYMHCNPQAFERDGEAVEITKNFKVPSELARRFNFWRRIYSVWSKEHYVLHIAEYPEVILSVYDTSRLSAPPMAKDREIKKFVKGERDSFKKLLLTMHQNRDHEERFTAAMQRIASNMRHINDRSKYLVAATNLRVQRGQRDFIATGLAVAPKYLPSIEAEFERQGVPVEITRLAFVESSFNLKAQSKVGASGVYQIMPATGNQYLRMFDGVDERNDPIKASRAAAKLLRLNYDLTGAWPLAITAYNHGVGGIRRATQAVNSRDIVELIDRYDGNQFGFASKNFYASFLGVLATLQQADRIFPEVAKVAPLDFTPLRLSKPASVKEICRKYTISVTDIAQLNPDISFRMIRSGGKLPTGYVIKLPAGANMTGRALASTSGR